MKKSEYCILDYDKKRKKYSEYGGCRSPFEIGIPLVDMSNKTVEQIYYFRWHTYCKHIKPTEDGYVITEFLPDVPWSEKTTSTIKPFLDFPISPWYNHRIRNHG